MELCKCSYWSRQDCKVKDPDIKEITIHYRHCKEHNQDSFFRETYEHDSIRCPHCGYLIKNEWYEYLTDEYQCDEHEETCPHCDKNFYIAWTRTTTITATTKEEVYQKEATPCPS